MKIAIIDPSLFTWPYDSELAQGLRHNGHEVVVYGKYLAEGEPGKGAFGYRELFYPGFNSRLMKSLPNSVFLALKGVIHPVSLIKLLGELRRFCPDVIHFQWAPLPAVDRHFIARFRRIAPVIFTVHDSTPFNNNPRSRLQRLGAIAIMRCFDRLIVHTEQAQKRLSVYGLPASGIARIPHGVMESDASGLAITAQALRTSEPVELLLFGKLKPYKGADILIRAIAGLTPSARARCRLRIVGKPYMDMAPLQTLAAELEVKANIVWDLRFVRDEEMAGIFSQADIMVMPYREIDASGVLMVALSIGRPVIASKIGLFAEMLEDGKHGYLVEPENDRALAKALSALIDNDPLRVHMGGQVSALKDSIPDWNTIARMTEELYRQAFAQWESSRASSSA